MVCIGNKFNPKSNAVVTDFSKVGSLFMGDITFDGDNESGDMSMTIGSPFLNSFPTPFYVLVSK